MRTIIFKLKTSRPLSEVSIPVNRPSMRLIKQYIVSTRVISTICHLVALIIIVFTREANIEVGLPDNPSDERKDWAHSTTVVGRHHQIARFYLCLSDSVHP